jgi:drug/metabolite transporter (DMT)-like permease
MFILSIAIVVISSVTYHLAQKYTNGAVNPVLALLLTYLTAMLGTLPLLLWFPLKERFSIELARLNWASVLLGFSVIGIEIGWILAYRAGWQINVGSLVGNLLVALVLLPVGWVIFQEGLTPIKGVGVAVCLVGLVLVNWPQA